ncbi:M1 family metallopeptidase [Kordiimonas aquimaris]|uniref:M1 family metallopeptidase n=1 Tax=Kordiimonas aquimaris TaxID=707591 RepID=UPI0021CEE98B|nr:M1 family aminopeptidase [Kordiimonas aquimaris]
MIRYGLMGCALVLAACTENTETEVRETNVVLVEPGVSLELAEHRKAAISAINYDLTFRIPTDVAASIGASETITFRHAAITEDLQLDFRVTEGAVNSVVVNGASAPIDHRFEHLVIPASYLRPGENVVTIEFTAGDTSLNRSANFLYTLFVPDRARTAFPVFDQPNLKATYDLTLDLPAGWQALGNGPVKSMLDAGDRRIHSFEKSDLLSSYLFSFVAGEFEAVTRTVGGREMTLLHRETDDAKIDRNLDAIFQLHADALRWLEDYTGIDYPFKKFDFAAIPAFQYGGMEHVGAIQYRSSSLFHDEDPSEAQLLGRASLIAHETAHMWFGDLVTMDWFNDVWTKEVFANFMASKIVNPNFPNIDHDLNFLLSRYPAAYSVDRTEGANPIRQNLPNLNEAGTMYGAIIYNKAPIMMRQLETLLGADIFRSGMREYLAKFAGANATWPDLIDILDAKSPHDLRAWSEVWVNTPGRPTFRFVDEGGEQLLLRQHDGAGLNRHWPQQFSITQATQLDMSIDANFTEGDYTISGTGSGVERSELFINADGMGYGLFPSSIGFVRDNWDRLSDLQKGSLFINLFEQMQEGDDDVSPADYATLLVWAAAREDNELLLGTLLGQLETVYWSFLGADTRASMVESVEGLLWLGANDQAKPASTRKVFLNRFRNMALSNDSIARLRGVWSGELTIDGISLSEREMIALAAVIAIKAPDTADAVLTEQLSQTQNPDARRRLEFLMPALSPDMAIRDAFFASLADEKNRAVESWVLAALGYLHHPLRVEVSEKYILPSLELLEEVQRTGDIFFPIGWTGQTLANHRSTSAVETVRNFLAERPNYNHQLRLKVLQAADRLFRANRIT